MLLCWALNPRSLVCKVSAFPLELRITVNTTTIKKTAHRTQIKVTVEGTTFFCRASFTFRRERKKCIHS